MNTNPKDLNRRKLQINCPRQQRQKLDVKILITQQVHGSYRSIDPISTGRSHRDKYLQKFLDLDLIELDQKLWIFVIKKNLIVTLKE